MFDTFHVQCADFASTNELLVFWMERAFGSQLGLIWKLAVVSVFWCIWFHRNSVIFEGIEPFYLQIISMVRSMVLEIQSLDGILGTMRNNAENLLILHDLGI